MTATMLIDEQEDVDYGVLLVKESFITNTTTIKESFLYQGGPGPFFIILSILLYRI